MSFAGDEKLREKASGYICSHVNGVIEPEHTVALQCSIDAFWDVEEVGGSRIRERLLSLVLNLGYISYKNETRFLDGGDEARSKGLYQRC